MGSQQQRTSSERTRVNWSLTMERYFIDLMLDQMHRGNRSGHTFSKQAWTEMLAMFNGKFRCKYDRDMLKTHYSFLWKQYCDLKNLLDQDGFSWDDTCKMVVADARAWDGYIKDEPDAEIYRGKAMPNFSDLCLIYAYTKADGRYSRSSHDLDFDDDVQGLITSAGTNGIAPVTMGHLEPEWTTAMDQFFMELMLDQTKRGNKNNSTLNKKAWKEILDSFNAKFCSKYNKGFLEHRYKELSKYYSDIRNLLKQKGFSWDKKRQIIVAEDDVWDGYIKVYPDAQSYRNWTLLDYQDLCLIYENLDSCGPRNRGQHDKNFEDVFLSETKGEDKVGHFSAGSEILKVCWTPHMDRYLTDLLLDQALKGNQIGHMFTDEAWTEMTTMFTAQFGAFCDSDSLKQRFKFLRKQYSDIKFLLEQSGFYWDDTRETVVAEDYIWDSYTKEYTEAGVYKNKSVPSYHKLCVIFGQENSHRRFSEFGDANLDLGEPEQTNGEESESPSESDYFLDHWTPPMDRHLIDLMLQQVCQGNRVGSSFSDEAWTAMSLSFVDRFGLPHDTALLRSRHKHFRRLYDDLQNILNRRGFSWDEKWQMVTAYNNVWDAFIKEYPDAKHYRCERNPNYNDFCLIYGNSASQATVPRHKNGYARKTDWKAPMDRFFIDLMLEQVRQGNMIGQKFNKQAWDTMAVKLISQFGPQHDKNSLKSRHLILRKRFNDVKNLLDQPGFAWDEAQQMVVANRRLWDAFIKEHPGARPYRNRSLPNYNDLFIIYGNRGTNGLENRSCLSMETENIVPRASCGRWTIKSATSSNSQGIKWTRTFQNHFIDLMLEQVRLGNNIGHTFSNSAWRWMIDAFNEKFGLQCSKYFLENQYQRLMTEYREITDLLNQDGFAWDGFLQMAVADDDVWEAQIEEHPEAAKYRNRNLDAYEDLCTIFGNRVSVFGPEPEITDDDQAMEASSDGVFGDLQCPGTDFEMPSLRKRRKSATFSPVWPSSRKPRRRENSMDGDAIETVVDALRAIPEMNDELFLEACKFMEDDRQAQKFVAMNLDRRSKWLRRKLRK